MAKDRKKPTASRPVRDEPFVPVYVPDRRNPELVGPLAKNVEIPDNKIGNYQTFKYLDTQQPRKAKDLADNGYCLGVTAWHDPAFVGWNPLISDFAAGKDGSEYEDRISNVQKPAISTDEAREWSEQQIKKGHENYINSQDTVYITRPGLGNTSKADEFHHVRTVTGLTGQHNNEKDELFYDLPMTQISYCANLILTPLAPGMKGTYHKKIGFYLGGTPGGGKTVFVKQLAAHIGAPCVTLPLMPDERLTERIFYTEALEAGRTVAKLTDVAYCYMAGGLLQIDDAQHQDDLGYLSVLLDPGVHAVTLKAADPELHNAVLVRHPAFRVVVTYNSAYDMTNNGLGTDIPSNVKDRMSAVASDWDGYELLKNDKNHWVNKHKDPKVRLYGLMAHAAMATLLSSHADSNYFESQPSVRAFNGILSDGSLINPMRFMPLNNPTDQKAWENQLGQSLADLFVNAKAGSQILKLMENIGENAGDYNTASEMERLYAGLYNYILDTYETIPSTTAFVGNMAKKTKAKAS